MRSRGFPRGPMTARRLAEPYTGRAWRLIARALAVAILAAVAVVAIWGRP